jgi:hypothetical protein
MVWNRKTNGLPTTGEYAVACTSDGTKIATAVGGTVTPGSVYASTNSGNTWAITTAPNSKWTSITTNSDGTFLAGCVYGGGIYISTDGGISVSFQTGAPTTSNWRSIAFNKSGTQLAAVSETLTPTQNGGIWVATYSGSSWAWVKQTISQNGTNVSNSRWRDIASNDSGTQLVAAINGSTSVGVYSIYIGYLVESTWYWYPQQNITSGVTSFYKVASNSIGDKLIAVGESNSTTGVYIGINSNVASPSWTWTQVVSSSTTIPNTQSWRGVCSDYTGSYLAIASYNTVAATGVIYTSTNGGSTWALETDGLPTGANWTGLASNSDGTRIVAISDDNGLYINYTNSNISKVWQHRTNGLPSTNNTYSLATSSDGTKLATCIGGRTTATTGGIYRSIDSGTTWTLTSAPTNVNWTTMSSNFDGTYLAATVYGGSIYISTDSGTTWTQQNNGVPTTSNWRSSVFNYTGSQLAVASDNGGIWIATYSSSTWSWAQQSISQGGTDVSTATWHGITSNYSGNQLAAVINNPIGTNSGVYIGTYSNSSWTWIMQTSTNFSSNFSWKKIASNSSGNQLIAVGSSLSNTGVYIGIYSIYTSTWNWSRISSSSGLAIIQQWNTVCSDSTGAILAVGGDKNGMIYTSYDHGSSWTQQTLGLPTSASWSRIVSSSDGTKLVAVSTDLGLYTGYVDSNICFPASTPIQTDQGIISIDKIDPSIHTIDRKMIVDITRTVSSNKYLICFKKNALGFNYPCEDTIMTKDHKIYFKDYLVPAERFLINNTNSATIYKIKYNGEILYNVLMEDYTMMAVNNIVCETLDPNNIIAKFHTHKCKYTDEQRDKILVLLDNCVKKKDYATYHKILQQY